LRGRAGERSGERICNGPGIVDDIVFLFTRWSGFAMRSFELRIFNPATTTANPTQLILPDKRSIGQRHRPYLMLLLSGIIHFKAKTLFTNRFLLALDH